MSEIRINIITKTQTISGIIHGSFGDVIVASLSAEPETIEELETTIQRFIKRESDWSFFRSFGKYENFEPWDAGLLVIDLSAKVIMADSTYSDYSTKGTILIKTDENEDFSLPYKLSDDWKYVRSMAEFNYAQEKGREKFLTDPPFDVRKVLFGEPLCSFIVAEYLTNKNAPDEDLFTNIHAKWLMSGRDDLRGKTPREILLEKQDFIGSDLDSRARQWSFTGFCPSPIPVDSNAYKFAGFGTHEIVVYYDLFRHLLGECFENNCTDPDILERLASVWLNNPQGEFSERTPAEIIEKERTRINLTVSVQECLIDDNCPLCVMMSEEFDTPTFCHFDGSQMEYDRFEFSFQKDRKEWEAEQREYEEMSRKFALESRDNFGFTETDETLF
jgi:hypothetical protein